MNFQTFNWCYHFPLYNLILDHHKPLLDLSLTVANAITNNAWNLSTIAPFQPTDAINHIQSMPLPLITHSDEFIWGPTGHDKFIIKLATELENSHIANHSHAKTFGDYVEIADAS